MTFSSTTLQGVCQQLMRYILFLMRYITRNNVKCSVYKKSYYIPQWIEDGYERKQMKSIIEINRTFQY